MVNSNINNFKIEGLSVSYSKKGLPTKQVLSGLSLEIDKTQFTAIMGANGCGKTTLLNVLARVVTPSQGNIIYGNKTVNPKIGYVWQDYRTSLLPWSDVIDNITFALKLKGISRKRREQLACDTLKPYSMINPYQKVTELSGGQQQLVAILRATISNPDILLFDEALSALDETTRISTALLIGKLWSANPIPAFFVSHSIDEAILLADEIVLLDRYTGNVADRIVNKINRPRHFTALVSKEAEQIRKRILGFLHSQNAITEITISSESEFFPSNALKRFGFGRKHGTQLVSPKPKEEANHPN